MKSEKAVVMGFVFVLAMLTFVGIASAATHHVNPGESIQAAVNAASDGDTIIVRDGTYTENVNLDKRLTICSENGVDSTIAQAASSDSPVFDVTEDYVTISGFTVKEARSTNIPGINLANVKHCNIYENSLLRNYCGIRLRQSSNNIIRNNTVLNSINEGIIVTSSSCNNTIMNNNASNNGFGILLGYYSNNNIIMNNYLNSNTIDGIFLFYSNNNTITNNNINSHHFYGIHLDSSKTNIIMNNSVLNNEGAGIDLYLSSNNSIYLNNFINNMDNVKSLESTNFWNSTSKITYVYNKTTYTNYLGNYWDDYTGSDEDGDGIGNTPYSIDSEKDNYPLMMPWENYLNKDLKLPVPYFTQGGTGWCWANALAMVLQYYGKEDHAWDLAESLGKRRIDGVSDWLGNDVANIQQYFEARGLEDLQHLRTPNYENPDGFFDGIRGIVDTYNTPVVISFPRDSKRHFIVVIGYQIIGQRKFLYIHDSRSVFNSFERIEHDVFYNECYSDAAIDCTYLWYVSRSYDPDPSAATMCIVDSSEPGTNYPNPEGMHHVHKVVDPDGVERPESWIILDRGIHYRINYDLICPGFVHPPVSYDLLRYYDTEVDGWKDKKKLILHAICVSNPNEENFEGELWIHLLQWDSIIDVYEMDISIEAWSAELIKVSPELDLQNIREGYGPYS